VDLLGIKEELVNPATGNGVGGQIDGFDGLRHAGKTFGGDYKKSEKKENIKFTLTLGQGL
jgi:hypothetical protein